MSSHDYYGGQGGGYNQPPPNQGYDSYNNQQYPPQQPQYGQDPHSQGHSPYPPQGQVSLSEDDTIFCAC